MAWTDSDYQLHDGMVVHQDSVRLTHGYKLQVTTYVQWQYRNDPRGSILITRPYHFGVANEELVCSI